jgi:hypothetical protein
MGLEQVELMELELGVAGGGLFPESGLAVGLVLVVGQ